MYDNRYFIKLLKYITIRFYCVVYKIYKYKMILEKYNVRCMPEFWCNILILNHVFDWQAIAILSVNFLILIVEM